MGPYDGTSVMDPEHLLRTMHSEAVQLLPSRDVSSLQASICYNPGIPQCAQQVNAFGPGNYNCEPCAYTPFNGCSIVDSWTVVSAVFQPGVVMHSLIMEPKQAGTC